MKNFILLLIVATSFTACGNDEEISKQDTLLGEWKLIEIRESGTINTIQCQDAIVLNFKKNGVFDVEHFGADESSNCISMGKISEGTWKSVGNNVYNIGDDSITPQFEGDKLIMVSTNGNENTSNGVYQRQ